MKTRLVKFSEIMAHPNHSLSAAEYLEEPMNLSEYIREHSQRGQCECGRCIDKDSMPVLEAGEHTVNNGFFQVSLQNEPTKDAFLKVLQNHKGVFGEADIFDGEEHNFMELGGWVGDQGIALQMMAMGALLGVWDLMTPASILGAMLSEDMKQRMAAGGMVTIKVNPEPLAA